MSKEQISIIYYATKDQVRPYILSAPEKYRAFLEKEYNIDSETAQHELRQLEQ